MYKRLGSAKLLIIVILLALVGASAWIMTQEQAARDACTAAEGILADAIESGPGLTPEEVHEKLGRKPSLERTPGKHRFVEEYRFAGPISTQIIYAYYETAATKLLEAVSVNQKMEQWEKGTH